MKLPRLFDCVVGLGVIVLAPLWGTAQGDSVFLADNKLGTLRVVKPSVVPDVYVKVDHFVPARKDRHRKRNGRDAAFINDKKNKRTSGMDYPMPATWDLVGKDSLLKINSQPKNANVSKTGDDLFGGVTIETYSFDYTEFFKRNLGYAYPWAETPASDTVLLKVEVTKRGEFSYSFTDARSKSALRIVDKKCFEALSHIKSWTVARVKYYNGRGSKVRRKKKVACTVLLTVYLAAKDKSTDFENLWIEAGE